MAYEHDALKGVTLGKLRMLIRVADSKGNLKRAANGDRNKASQLSGDLKELGSVFGVELLNAKQEVLTSDGKDLARIAREFIQSLEDFSAITKKRPIEIRFGAGDRLLHWILLPNLGRIQADLPSIRVSLHNFQTKDVVEGLKDFTLDLGLIRKSGVVPPLVASPVQEFKYALFVPTKLVPKGKSIDAIWVLENVPLVVQGTDSEFHNRLKTLAREKKISLQIRLCCESYPQAFRAVFSESFAGVLPNAAASDLGVARFQQLNFDFTEPPNSQIVLAYHPRLLQVRARFGPVIECFRKHLSAQVLSSQKDLRKPMDL